jgi:2-keto-4-pentenoate hydratase/2-oxohepta-3-ene-1,7-dioic acid hydratase in catechol pathway
MSQFSSKQVEVPSFKMVFLARSFGKHALELGNPIPESPLYFLKAPSTRIGPQDSIRLPPQSQEVHYEAEVAFYLNKSLYQCTLEDTFDAIGEWTILNDITARDLQKQDQGRFTRAKNFDTFCPISSITLDSLDWKKAKIQGWLNGELKQDSSLNDLLYTPFEALYQIAQVMTLNEGDLISLGTPAGVGPLHSGDHFEVRLCDEKGTPLLTLHNPII